VVDANAEPPWRMKDVGDGFVNLSEPSGPVTAEPPPVKVAGSVALSPLYESVGREGFQEHGHRHA
jgi:hypothetical protein